MKKLLISLIVVTLIICLCACNKTFDGYCYNLEDARNEEQKYYEQYDYLFTAEEEGIIIDFIIDGDQLHIVKIEITERDSNRLYWARSISTSFIHNSEKNTEYEWNTTSNFVKQVEWLIVSKEFNQSHNNYQGFNFVYNDKQCVLCYRISE
jgi:hypothetical protein